MTSDIGVEIDDDGNTTCVALRRPSDGDIGRVVVADNVDATIGAKVVVDVIDDGVDENSVIAVVVVDDVVVPTFGEFATSPTVSEPERRRSTIVECGRFFDFDDDRLRGEVVGS